MQVRSSEWSANYTRLKYFLLLPPCSLLMVPVIASYAFSPPSVSLLEPIAKNMAGDVIHEVAVGGQAELVLSFYNTVSGEEDLSFGAIIEVRNSDDVTIFLAWQSGKVAPDKQYHFSTSWNPEQEGVYYLKTRVITALPPAEIRSVLSPVLETKMLVV